MIFGIGTLVQVGHKTFVKCKKGAPEVIKIPALGREYYKGDFVVLQDKLTGERASFEIVGHTQCELSKEIIDPKGRGIPKTYTIRVEPAEIEQDLYNDFS